MGEVPLYVTTDNPTRPNEVVTTENDLRTFTIKLRP